MFAYPVGWRPARSGTRPSVGPPELTQVSMAQVSMAQVSMALDLTFPRLLGRSAAAASIATVLSGCALVSGPPPAAPAPALISETTRVIIPNEKPSPAIAEGLNDAERLRHAIALLEQGNAEQARAELEAYIAAVPDSAVAQRMLFQIDAPLANLYPQENFTVELQSSESLSSLSGHYLNEVLGFYGLARYNGITNPSRVVAGQRIKIPATTAALAARDTKRAVMVDAQAVDLAVEQAVEDAGVTSPADSWSAIVAYVEAERFGAAVLEAESSGVTPGGEQAAILARAYEGVARQLGANARLLSGTRALRAGQLYMEAGQSREALAMFDLALELTPGSTSARALRDQARQRVVEEEYHAGLRAFQREQLEDAIAHFDRALEIDPSHRDANINRAQAIELRSTPN